MEQQAAKVLAYSLSGQNVKVGRLGQGNRNSGLVGSTRRGSLQQGLAKNFQKRVATVVAAHCD